MVETACIGFCRSSDNKKFSESVRSYAEYKINDEELLRECKRLRLENWKTQKKYGIDYIISNDFTIVDKMLDTTCLVGNIQRRYYWEGGKIPLEIYFLLAFGIQRDKFDVLPLERRNWLDTNYLYFVPEFTDPLDFSYSDNKPIVEFLEAKSIGIDTVNSILSPLSYILMGENKGNFANDYLLQQILPVYQELFINYKRIGVKHVQIEDPMICLNMDDSLQNLYRYCYEKLRGYADDILLTMVSYHDNIMNNFSVINSLPVDIIHIDIPYNISELSEIINNLPKDKKISVGVVEGDNILKNNILASIDLVSKFCDKIGSENIFVSNSCPMFLTPYSIKYEQNIPINLKNKMAFGVEKLEELSIIKNGINNGKKSISDAISAFGFERKKSSSTIVYKNIDNNEYRELTKKKDNKQEQKKNFADFLKENNIDTYSVMFFDAIEDKTLNNIQNSNDAVNVYSVSALRNSYDISILQDYFDGTFTLKNNQIPRYGYEYYSPNIIFDKIKIKQKMFSDLMKSIKTTKPIKFSICSPNHYINFSFLITDLDKSEIEKSLFVELEKIISDNLKKFNILQINDFALTSNTKINNINKIVKDRCLKNKDFLHNFDNKIYCATYLISNQVEQNISDVLLTATGLVMLESASSGSRFLRNLLTYKTQVCFCCNLFDSRTRRLPTSAEVDSTLKMICNESNIGNLTFGIDSCLIGCKTEQNIFSIIKTMVGALKSNKVLLFLDKNVVGKTKKNKKKKVNKK